MRARALRSPFLFPLLVGLLGLQPLAAAAAPPSAPPGQQGPVTVVDGGLRASAGSWVDLPGGSAWQQVELYLSDAGAPELYLGIGSSVDDGEGGYVRESWSAGDCGNPTLEHGGIDPALASAWVDQVVELTGIRCVPDPEGPDGEACTGLGSDVVSVKLDWVGTGRITRSVYPSRWVDEDGIVYSSRYRTDARAADVSGGILGEMLDLDLSGPGVLESWSSSSTTRIPKR